MMKLAGAVLMLMVAQLDGGSQAAPQTAKANVDGGLPSSSDAGVTDVATLVVGESLKLKFSSPVLMSVCDDPIVGVDPKANEVTITGEDAGVTLCGFWLLKSYSAAGAQPVPDHLYEVRVRSSK